MTGDTGMNGSRALILVLRQMRPDPWRLLLAAFTGAAARRLGLFESADGGTVFLDEIGDLPLDVQTNLLRVLRKARSNASAATSRSRSTCG